MSEPVTVVAQLIGSSIFAADETGESFTMRAFYSATALSADNLISPFEADENGNALAWSLYDSVPVEADDSRETVEARVSDAIVAAFGHPDLPVVFI